ncbi:uncharacterized protein LOC116294615 [Actinia tenebrosa]|uniref:Uncharacterized protein LOC116294615 n=1 Tax=Actinia tenebrosa TaxID=6105 RepID=A0A6P8HZS8_ACTTE|nr:uncharacterized protein LOC116294615 [Actinia tenebrosa]
MASVTSIRSCVDQENSQQALRVKNGVQARSFGQVKSFNSTGNNAPLATPRRALGDVGNTLMTPGNVTKKSSLLKPSHQNNLLQSKTPGAKKMTHSTPHGKALSKQIGSLSLKQNKKQAFKVRGDVSTSDKSSALVEKNYFKKENMVPFTDEEGPLPRGPAIDTILKNVSQLYRGCLQPVTNPGVSLESDVLKTGDDAYTRPETDLFFNWFEFANDLSDLTSNVPSSSMENVELPPIDTDLSGLGLP